MPTPAQPNPLKTALDFADSMSGYVPSNLLRTNSSSNNIGENVENFLNEAGVNAEGALTQAGMAGQTVKDAIHGWNAKVQAMDSDVQKPRH